MGGQTSRGKPMVLPEFNLFAITQFPLTPRLSNFSCPKILFPERGGIIVWTNKKVRALGPIFQINNLFPDILISSMIYLNTKG